MNQAIVKNFDDFEILFNLMREMHPESYFQIKWKTWEKSRSLDQNSLYWMWLDRMAKHFSKQQKFTNEDMHDLMRHQFLGYEDKQISKTKIVSQLKSTTKLSTKEMSEYMTKVEAWAADNGCLLPRPEDMDHAYNVYREAAV